MNFYFVTFFGLTATSQVAYREPEVDCYHLGDRRRTYALAQNSTPARVTKADAQKVLKIISSDKVKTRIYCQMAKLGNQMEQANETGDAKKFDAFFQRMYELGKKLGPEYAALIDGLQDINPESEIGQEISSTLDALDNLCGG